MATGTHCRTAQALLVTNKLCLQIIPAPSFVAGVQFASAAVFARALRFAGVPVDRFTWKRVRPYLIHVIFFYGAIYFNMAALRLSSVGTVLARSPRSPAAPGSV